MTVLSPVGGSGEVRNGADQDAGRCLRAEEGRKTERYQEVADCDSVSWRVLGHTLYGYTRDSTCNLIAALAKHKARNTNPHVQRTAQIYWRTRFWDMLSCTLARAVAAHYQPSYPRDPPGAFVPVPPPYLEDLL